MGNARGRDGRRGRVDGMARGARKRSAKRAKVDKADKKEEEDPLVRRREELVLGFWNARAEGKKLVREAEVKAKLLEQPFLQDMRPVCADIQAKNEKLLRRLPPELWDKILDEYLHQNDHLALAMTCRFFYRDVVNKLETNLFLNEGRLLELRKSGKMTPHTLGWFQWVCDTFEIMPGFQWTWHPERVKGAVYECDLINYAALNGSVEILRWLMEEKGWEQNDEHEADHEAERVFWAARGGSIEVLEYLMEWGYEFGNACTGAAREGHLEALKWARDQDPPCPWNEDTCPYAAYGGHLEVLKWARSEDPPVPWDGRTCKAAVDGGNLDVLKWLRAQNPPCPWNRRNCEEAASREGHQHVIDWIDQQEDESDEEYREYSDSDSD